jgi:excisionase family DNA binding protein
MTSQTKQFAITVKDAAEMLCVSKPTVYKLIKDNKLKPRKVGGRTVFITKEVEDFVLNSLPEVAA